MQRELEMPVTQRVVTAEEFERMPDEPGVRRELVRGRVIRMSPAGYQHGEIATRILRLLAEHAEREGLGRVVMPTGFKIQSNPDTVREPDVAFVSRARLASSGSPAGFFPGTPDLAVEVVSPTDRPALVDAKVAQYLESGVRMVWVVDPRQEAVTVLTPGTEPVTLREGAVIDGADILPGFACDIRLFFQ